MYSLSEHALWVVTVVQKMTEDPLILGSTSLQLCPLHVARKGNRDVKKIMVKEFF